MAACSKQTLGVHSALDALTENGRETETGKMKERGEKSEWRKLARVTPSLAARVFSKVRTTRLGLM